jgi:hypothetical protein
LVTNYYLQNAGINSGKDITYLNSPWDLVPNIIGLNTLNPIKIIGSIIAAPTLFMGPAVSPHTLPYSPPPPHTLFTQEVTP